MTLQRFTFLMYLQKFFAEFNPIYPLYALMFVEFGGLTPQLVGWLFIIWFTAAVIAEIPTGIVADKISRRNSSLIGRLLLIGTFICWYVSPTFWGFAFGFILWGIGFAFTSGATDSYLFETIKKLGGGTQFTKLYSHSATVRVFGMFCAYILAIFLIPFGYETLLLISIGVSFIVPVILLMMPMDSTEHMQHRSHFSVLSEAWVVICSKRTVFVLATFLMFLSGIIGLMEEYVPLYYSWNGFKTEFVTVMLTVGLLGATFIQMLSHFFDRFHQRILFGLVLLAGVVLFSTHYFLGWAAVLGFYAFMRILKLMETSLTARMHTLIDTDARSTAMSLVTFVAEITGIVFAGMLIFFQYYYSDIMSVALLGAATALISLWFVVVKS